MCIHRFTGEELCADITLTRSGIPSDGDPSNVTVENTYEQHGEWFRRVHLRFHEITRHEMKTHLAGDCGPDVSIGRWRGPGWGVENTTLYIDMTCEGIFSVCGVGK